MGEIEQPHADDEQADSRFSQEQYDMLLRCSENRDMTEWKEWIRRSGREVLLEGADLSQAYLQGAYLAGAHLEGAVLEEAHLLGANLANAHLECAWLRCAKLGGANLQNAHLEDAYLPEADLECAWLRHAHLERADLTGARMARARLLWSHLEETYLSGARLEGVDLTRAHLESADFAWSVVSGETVLQDCTYDRDTDFTGVGLGNARVSPGLRSALEANVRRFFWKDWYRSSRYKNRVARFLAPIFKQPVRVFWAMSDYGQSTSRIVATFFGAALLFALIYFLFPGLVAELHLPGTGLGETFLRSCYFSVVTMTTLGFGDMHAEKGSILGYLLLMLHVILGYIILGALVTRLAVLFRET